MTATDPIRRWKTPDDLRRRLAAQFERLVAADLRAPGGPIDPFPITTPGLSAAVIAARFAEVRAWADRWLDAAAGEPGLDLTTAERQDRNFGRVRIAKVAQVRSVDAVARLVRRVKDLSAARRRHRALTATDARLAGLADCWPAIVALSDDDFDLVLRFVAEVAVLDLSRLRLREVSVAGMHTKFLEDHRAVLRRILAALGVPARPDARTWPGKLGFVEDDTTMVELRDLDGRLLPYPHLSLPLGQLMRATPLAAAGGIVIVENKATFLALPAAARVLAIFGQSSAVRPLGMARWLGGRPLLYLGDLDQAGFQMVAGLRRDGLVDLKTALMDVATAEAHRHYWVADTSPSGTERAYEGLTEAEHAAARLMAGGPWRLEQERIPFDLLVDAFERWRRSIVDGIVGPTAVRGAIPPAHGGRAHG